MKKTVWLPCAAAALLVLGGCSDAKAEISDGDKVVAKVGNKEISKEDLYNTMKMSNAYNVVIEQVTRKIVDKEVPATKEMEEAARTSFEAYKKTAGSSFDEYLKNSGYKDEDTYFRAIYVVDQQKTALTKKYVEANFKQMMSEYRPMKAQIIACDTEEKAKQALEAVKGGKSFEEAVKSYGNNTNFSGAEQIVNSKTTGMSSVAFTQMKKVNKNGTMVDKVINDASTGKFYVVKVNETDPEKFKDDAIKSVTALDEVKDKAFTTYLKKYKFTIYDIDVYNSIKESKPSYVIQD